MTTPLLGLAEIAEGVANQTTIHNMALRQLEALLVRALSKDTAAPPASPAAGDSYIIPSEATGAWAGKGGQIAAFIGGAWSYFTVGEGVRLWVNDLDAEYVFDGAAWVINGADAADFLTQAAADAAYDAMGAAAAAVAAHAGDADPHPGYLTQTEGDARYLQSIGAQPFDVTAFYPGVPSASAIITRVPVARAVTFPSGLTGSIGRARVAATAQTVFDVQKNGASVGSITFAASATSATLTAASAVTLAAGDILAIIAPGSADTTLADVGVVLAGTR